MSNPHMRRNALFLARRRTTDFVLARGQHQAPVDLVLRVTPEQAARVLWLRRARQAWSAEARR